LAFDFQNAGCGGKIGSAATCATKKNEKIVIKKNFIKSFINVDTL